ncbi:PAS domain-containing sensor histidine kinase, partial [Rhizobium mayense]|nr:PAS domain-containing sensor histidine kinase [Rhizobium mayense]
MPAIQYPFIDIAVHPRVRERFARGEALVLFATGMDRVLWANGAGANLFGYDVIYDFLDQGPKAGDVSFRQIEATARGLGAVGDQRTFLIRMASGFQRAVVNASVEIIRVQAGEEAILFSSPVSSKPLAAAESAKRMIDGFDDPDTHMAVIGRDGEVIAASARFDTLGVTPQTARMLTTMAGAQAERLIKRPIPTGHGYLPAAVGKLSEIPALHLLFVVETVAGHLDPTESLGPGAAAAAAVEPEAEEARKELETAAAEETPVREAAPIAEAPSPDVIDAVADIEEVEDAPENSAASHEETHPQSDAAGKDIDALVMMDSATPEQIEAAAHADELVPDVDDDLQPSLGEGPVDHADTTAEPPAAKAVAPAPT